MTDFQCGSHPRLMIVLTSHVSWTFYKGQVSFLRRSGLDLEVASGPGPKLDEMRSEGAKTWTVPMEREIAPLKDLVSLLRLWLLFLRRRPELVIAGTPKAGLLGTVAARLAGVPHVVYAVLGLRMETARGWKRRILWLTEWIACRAAHHVRCVSTSLKARVIGLGLAPEERCRVVGPGTVGGVDVDHWSRTPSAVMAGEEMRARLGIPQQAIVMGYVGRFTRDKGMRELYEAFTSLHRSYHELWLLLVGDFEAGDPMHPALRKRLEADPKIIRTGYIADVAPYYWAMDILVVPTYREGFPGVSLEAQAASLPVVTTDATGALDAIIDGFTGIRVPVGDVDALTSALNRLLGDPDLRASMGQAGRAWVEDNFRREQVWERVCADYHSILNGDARGPRSSETAVFTRCLDVVVPTVMLLLTTPLWFAAAIAVRWRLGAPILFRQMRPGLKGRPFTVLKFRSMRDERDNTGVLLPDAERLTRIGRILRGSSIDELPQLWNVLRGEMSLVGPRPLLMQYLDRYTPEQARRHEVKPGITGWAQVNGRNGLGWEERLRMDVWYVDHRSFWLDLKILWLTLHRVLKPRGISSGSHVTMPEFLGLPNPTGTNHE